MEESEVLFDQPTEDETPVEEPLENQESMESLLEAEGLGFDFPKTGETRTGVIASISSTEILVSVGAKSEGIVGGREFDQIENEVRSSFQVGQEIPVYILSPEDKNGNLVLSYNRACEERDWDTAEQLKAEDEIYESKVIGFNKGGLLVELGQLRGFVPASQIGLSRRLSLSGDTPEKRYSDLIGEPLSIRVIEVDRSRRRLILSERMALKETRESLKDKLLDDLQVGDVRTGRVTSLADFGAFVNIDGADGLVHLSEISWERIQHPKDVLNIGQEVNVEVISIDRDRKRIGLSIRRLEDNPWVKKVEHIREGQLVEGTITHLTKFGAFAKLGDEELEGLIHVSELSQNRVEHPKEIVSEGETMTLRVIKIDADRQRIGLSLRKVDSAAYADLDWKMLRDELDSALEEDIPDFDAAEAEKEQTVDEDLVEIASEEEGISEDQVEVESDETELSEESMEDQPEEPGDDQPEEPDEDQPEDPVEDQPEEIDDDQPEEPDEDQPEETDDDQPVEPDEDQLEETDTTDETPVDKSEGVDLEEPPVETISEAEAQPDDGDPKED
jgi:small subunit ribosomal protein S1